MSPPRSGGFTLVEAVICVVLVAVMMVAALSTLGGVAKARAMQLAPQDSEALGRGLLSEIVQARYEDPDVPGAWGLELGEAGGTRADFDDLDDYDSWSASPPQSKDGTPMADYEGWTRTVLVSNIEPLTVTPAGSDLGLRMIVVGVEDPQGNRQLFQALRCNKGLGEVEPVYETTYVTWAGVDLKVGADSASTHVSGVHLANQPTGE